MRELKTPPGQEDIAYKLLYLCHDCNRKQQPLLKQRARHADQSIHEKSNPRNGSILGSNLQELIGKDGEYQLAGEYQLVGRL